MCCKRFTSAVSLLCGNSNDLPQGGDDDGRSPRRFAVRPEGQGRAQPRTEPGPAHERAAPGRQRTVAQEALGRRPPARPLRGQMFLTLAAKWLIRKGVFICILREPRL